MPPDHRECARCATLLADAAAVSVCPECYAALERSALTVERARERRRVRLASTGTERYITPVEAAALLAVTPRHVRRLAARGRLPYRRIEHRLWLRESAVRALVSDGGPSAA